MNLYDLNELIRSLQKDSENNKELIDFYLKKKKELLKTISERIKTQLYK